MATQVMAPPSEASMPQSVPRYSSHLGALKPRWVSRRWKVMPIPSEPATQLRNRRAKRPVHVKFQSAVTAAKWMAAK